MIAKHHAERVARQSSSPITRPRLERALAVVAEIVTRPGGDVYLPIFQRLERELATFADADSSLARAHAIAARVIPTPSR